ncbi:isovaleryl-CoA dehydrogenase-like protein, partial [Leptotrombidium deliense]
WTCDSWKKQKVISAEEGIVSIAYERKFHEYSRLYQLMKLYLYAPSSGLYSCPLAMTDGLTDSLIKEAYNRLITRDANRFWTSGQWMTEKAGVFGIANGTETIAVPVGNNAYRLYGYKWFSSAADSEITLTLARVSDMEGNFLHGTRGLTLFFLKTRDDNGALNNINVVKLKDKLGTRQLPTAELLLDGTLAYKISEEGRGVASIAHMLHVTRIYNAISAVGGMRRILLYSRDYMHRRKVFGKHLFEIPLHVQTLSRMDVETRASLILLFEVQFLYNLIISVSNVLMC